MSTKRPTTREQRRSKKPVQLPVKWEPKFLSQADQRAKVVRLIRKRLQRLLADANCQSVQQQLLANEAVFISVQLETMRVNAIEGKSFDAGQYTQMVNCLAGLLGPQKLGLTKQATNVLDLDAYVASKAKARSS